MAQNDRARIAIALVLILIGLWFLSVQFVPFLSILSVNHLTWPLTIVGLGAIFALFALLSWTPGLMIPACIIGGVGGLLYWQNLTNHWESWSYAWALIPGFVGLGVFLSSLMQGRFREALTAGGWLMLISLILFTVFGSFFGMGIDPLTTYWPALLILLGVITLAQGFLGRRGRPAAR